MKYENQLKIAEKELKETGIVLSKYIRELIIKDLKMTLAYFAATYNLGYRTNSMQLISVIGSKSDQCSPNVLKEKIIPALKTELSVIFNKKETDKKIQHLIELGDKFYTARSNYRRIKVNNPKRSFSRIKSQLERELKIYLYLDIIKPDQLEAFLSKFSKNQNVRLLQLNKLRKHFSKLKTNEEKNSFIKKIKDNKKLKIKCNEIAYICDVEPGRQYLEIPFKNKKQFI